MILKITKAEIEEFLKLDQERKSLEQQARAISKRTDALKDHFKAFLAEADKPTLRRHGYQLTLTEGRPSVSWKDEFIRVAGPLAADDVLTNAPRNKQVEITQVA